MARKTDFSKLKKDELASKLANKLGKERMVQLLEGIQDGSVNVDSIGSSPNVIAHEPTPSLDQPEERQHSW